jgi:hypothetical protein
MPIYLLRRHWRESKPVDADVAVQLRDGALIDNPAVYWERLVLALEGHDSIQFLLESADLMSYFDVQAASTRGDVPFGTSPPARSEAQLLGQPPSVVEEGPVEALELDALVDVGPISVTLQGFLDADRQCLSFHGVSGKGKVIWSRRDSKGRRNPNAKIYAEVLVKRVQCGLRNSILQYVVVYQNSIGKWHTERNIRAAPTPASEAEEIAAVSATRSVRDSNTTSFEIVGAKINVEPIRIQAVSDSGCVLFDLDGITAAYSQVSVGG